MFSRSSGQGQWQAANRHAMRVDDVERGAQPFRYQRVAAGSGLTPIAGRRPRTTSSRTRLSLEMTGVRETTRARKRESEIDLALPLKMVGDQS